MRAFVRVCIAVLALTEAVLAQGAMTSGPIGVARLRLEGPLDGAVVELGGPRTIVHVELAAGEVLHVAVPLEGALGTRPGAPSPELVRVTPDGAGSAEVVAWEIEPVAAPAVAARPGEASVSRAEERLARRTRPPLAPGRARMAHADLAVIAAALLLGLALRRRSGAVLVVGVLGAAAVFALPTAEPEPVEVRVIEGDLSGSGAWIEVRAGLGSLRLVPGLAAAPTVDPPGCAYSYVIDLRPPASRSTPAWHAVGAGCTLVLARSLDPQPLGPDQNALGRLDPLWTRTPDGLWERRGPWAIGAALPSVQGRNDAPPAWLAAALPQGRSIRIGRLVPDATASEPETWVRVVGP